MIKTKLAAFIAALSIALIGASTPAFAGEATDELKRTDRQLRRLIRQKNRAKGAAVERYQQKITARVNAFLDFEDLARQALKKHWTKRTEAEQKEFVQLLRDLIERNYVKQLNKNLDYKVQYRDELRKGDRAKVTTAVKVTRNNRPAEVVIEYKMKKENGRWLVYDVITDDVSIVRNYRSQFNRIIRKNSYEHLVKKMRSKLQETESAT